MEKLQVQDEKNMVEYNKNTKREKRNIMIIHSDADQSEM